MTKREVTDAEVEQVKAKIQETIKNAPRVQEEDMANFRKFVEKEEAERQESMNHFERVSAELDRNFFWMAVFSGATLLIAGLTVGIPLVRYFRQR